MADHVEPAGVAVPFKWSNDETRQLILWLFTGKRNAAVKGFGTYIEESGLRGKVEAGYLKKKWENMVAKYKDLKSPRTGVSSENGETTAASWKWYGLLDEAMGASHVIAPVVLISSSAPYPSSTDRARTGRREEAI